MWARAAARRQFLRRKGDFVEMTAESPDVGRAYEEVPSHGRRGHQMAFNARY
jgi:hypothetical protein